ncbi:MAG: phosphatidylserine/phosphatidylglycerophosphate/cardiolipin synthase family protein [Isosphaeraceae bacterium]
MGDCIGRPRRGGPPHPAGTLRTLVPAAFVLALAAPTQAEDRPVRPHRRELPANAVVRPGIDTVGYPEVGRRQVMSVVGQVAASSAGSLVSRPLRSSAQVVARWGERLGVRGRELSSFLGTARPADCIGQGGDGGLDGPFGSPPMPARVTLLPSSESAVTALLALIGSAGSRVDLMMYGWEDDPTGREVADALEAAARRGVAVRLLVDRAAHVLHNPGAAQGIPTFLTRLARVPNVCLILPPDPFLKFDHRKLAVVDGRVAWSGGMILTEVARRKWENVAFLAEGPVVEQYGAVFEDRWREVGGRPSGPAAPPGSNAMSDPNATIRLVRTDVGERSLKDAVYHAVDHARFSIYLENPYFSDDLLADKLVAARKRGVDVRAVLTLRGNVERLNRYVVLTANRLLRGGVKVYLSPGMTHVKAMSADGVWAYLGTGNFDELSLRNNREVGLSLIGPEVVGRLDADVFLTDMARAQELTAPLPLPDRLIELELFKLWF